MRTEVVPFAELSSAELDRWSEIQLQNPELASPYFRPEFAQHVAAVRSDVEVAVLSDEVEIVGFLPFQRTMWGVAKPVGGRLSDYHGLIAPAGLKWSPTKLLRDCKLSSFEFHHLIATQADWQPYCTSTTISPIIDVSAGFEAYLENRRAEKLRLVTDSLKRFEKLERQVGPITIEWNTADERVLEQLFSWKSSQYAETGMIDIFAFDWTRQLIKNIWKQSESSCFRGLLCTMRAGERTLAMHFGMQSGATMHSWFPAYDVEFAKHSPGILLLMQIARRANEHGIKTIDLGKGDEQYKRSFCNTSALVAEGVVEVHPLRSAIRNGWKNTRELVKNSPLAGPARMPARWIRQMREWLSMK